MYKFNTNDLLKQFVHNAIILGFVLLPFSCSQNKSIEKIEALNALQFEESAYLKRHASNPIDWHAWSDETLKKAQKENKLMVISIGYFSCFWCHVMEEETFTDTLVAKIMNEHFISVKVDREERPDIDLIYTEAAMQMTGNAGWPLNIIATSDGKPLFAGTYFERADWLSIIERASYLYQESPETILEDAQSLASKIQVQQKQVQGQSEWNMTDLESLWLQRIDKQYGGLNVTQKFPNAPFLQSLLDYTYYYPSATLDEFLKTTLDHMATGGLFDVVSGGFYRYATDAKWQVPHFEKMLYDNAQLINVYAKAYQKFKNPFYLHIAERTLQFLKHEMVAGSGGFVSSINAVSENEEGAFYTWTYEELKTAGVTDDILNAFNVTKTGNWENGKNILHSTPNFKKDIMTWFESGTFHFLKALQSKRKLPTKDFKVLSGWNALIIQSYVNLYQATGSDQYLIKAREQAQWLWDNFFNAPKKWVQRSNHQTNMAFLEDQALMIDAFIDLYQVDMNEKWLVKARNLTVNTLKNFNPIDGLYPYCTEDSDLFLEAIPTLDTNLPSGNALMARNLMRLGEFYFIEHGEWFDLGIDLLHTQKNEIQNQPTYKGEWIKASLLQKNPPYEIAIVGDDFRNIQKAFYRKGFHPDWVMMGGTGEGEIPLLKNKAVKGQTVIYVCIDKVCKLPTRAFDQAFEMATD